MQVSISVCKCRIINISTSSHAIVFTHRINKLCHCVIIYKLYKCDKPCEDMDNDFIQPTYVKKRSSIYFCLYINETHELGAYDLQVYINKH